MRYQLDNIPVWDAYKAGGECPLCALRAQNEQMYVESFLGASVMEPSTRVEVNAKGFCGPHLRMMFAEKNRLGLALIAHTHYKDVLGTVTAQLEAGKSGGRKGLFGGKSDAGPAAAVRARLETCVLCERLDYTLHRYAYTLVHLWAHDADFRKTFAASQGLCLPDMAMVMDMADELLSGKQRQEFYAALAAVQGECLAQMEKDLEWFTLKFDYRNQDKPWGNSRDAVERTIYRLRGRQRDMRT